MCWWTLGRHLSVGGQVISSVNDRVRNDSEVVISSLSGNLVWGIPFERSLARLLARLLELFVQDRCGSREERSQGHARVVVDISPSPIEKVSWILPREDEGRQPLNG